MTASRCLLYGKTSRMHRSGVILAHSSTQTQTVFKYWKFRGPLLWTLIFSSFHRFFKSGDWLILAALFSFSETNWEFPWLCVWDYCLAGMSTHVSSGTEPANINFHWLGTGLISNYWLAFYAFLHLCVQYFFPVSFNFITHNLISELICFVFFVCMCLCVTDIWWKFHVNSTFRNIFIEKNGDVFNTYNIYIYI